MSRTSGRFILSRPAFTLVELLVAMALILFIMSIVSVVFGDATESFRIFRSRAELSEKLRFITQTLRADLRSNHFENGRRLSDSTFWDEGPPQAGYFRIEETSPGSRTTTIDGDDILTAGPADKHVLMFTSFLTGQDYRGFHSISINDPSESTNFNSLKAWLRSSIPSGLNAPDDSRLESSNSYNSPNAEIAWFLGDPAIGGVSVTPYEFATNGSSNKLVAPDIDPNLAIFKLYRRVWPLLPNEITGATTTAPTLNTFTQNRLSQVPNSAGLTAMQRLNYISSQLDSKANVDVMMRRGIGNFFTNSSNISTWRNPGFNTNTSSAQWAVVADNVLSFSIEGWFEGQAGFYPLDHASGLGGGQRVFDTWSGRKPDATQGIADASNPAWLTTNGFWNSGWKTDPSSVVPMPRPMLGGNPRRLLAVRITIRLYDLNTKSTWQATVIEYL